MADLAKKLILFHEWGRAFGYEQPDEPFICHAPPRMSTSSTIQVRSPSRLHGTAQHSTAHNPPSLQLGIPVLEAALQWSHKRSKEYACPCSSLTTIVIIQTNCIDTNHRSSTNCRRIGSGYQIGLTPQRTTPLGGLSSLLARFTSAPSRTEHCYLSPQTPGTSSTSTGIGPLSDQPKAIPPSGITRLLTLHHTSKWAKMKSRSW